MSHLTPEDMETLREMRDFYLARVSQAEFLAQLPDKHRLFGAQARRDQKRADLLDRILRQIQTPKAV